MMPEKSRASHRNNVTTNVERGSELAAAPLFLLIKLEDLNALSLPALGALDHIELNLLAFLQ